MLYCAKWFFRLPYQSQVNVMNKVKSKTWIISVHRQLHSPLLFQHSPIARSSPCILSVTSDVNRFVLPSQHNSSYLNTSVKNDCFGSPCLYRYHLIKYYCSNAAEPEKKPSLLQRFKQMYKEYWYVLVPVHLITSAFWFTSFYYLTRSGVDIASFLESIGAGEKLVAKLRNGNSTMGYIAISYALYKIATPVRYTVTLGGTTLSIKYLRDWGYIKPIPPKDKLKEIIHEKKDIFMEKKETLKNRYKEKGLFERILLKLRLKKKSNDKD